LQNIILFNFLLKKSIKASFTISLKEFFEYTKAKFFFGLKICNNQALKNNSV